MLNQIAKEVFECAEAKGLYTTEMSFEQFIAMCHAELSEALEQYRLDNGLHEIRYLGKGQDNKPEGVPVELADCMIMILSYCGYVGIDIEKAFDEKREYNKHRPYKHGRALY